MPILKAATGMSSSTQRAWSATQSGSIGSTDSTPAYLKLSVSLELDGPEGRAAIEPVMPRVVDQFQTYLRELRPSDINGSAGLFRLKEELTKRVNNAVAPQQVSAVLFKEIVVQ